MIYLTIFSGVYRILVINTDHNEIFNLVHALKSSESKDVDNISPKLLKMLLQPYWTRSYMSLISPSDSFLLGQFPNKMKIAKIVPVYKSDAAFLGTANEAPLRTS